MVAVGKVAVITGASSGRLDGRKDIPRLADQIVGIGRATAVKLSSEGWAVVLSARRENELENTASMCPGETLLVVGDVTKEADVVHLFEATIRRFGRLDMLFNVSPSQYKTPVALSTNTFCP